MKRWRKVLAGAVASVCVIAAWEPAAAARPNPDTANPWDVAIGIDINYVASTSTATFVEANGVNLNNCGGPLFAGRTACNFVNRYVIDGTVTNGTPTASSSIAAVDHINLFDEPDPEGGSFVGGSAGEVFEAPTSGQLQSFSLFLACKSPDGGALPPVQATLFSVSADQTSMVAALGSTDIDLSQCPTSTSFNPAPSTFAWIPANFDLPVTAGTSYAVLLTGAAIGGDEPAPAVAASSIDGALGPLTAGVGMQAQLSTDSYPVSQFSLGAGTLPSGLTLDPASGMVSGSPTASGPYDFTVTATNTAGATSRRFTGVIRSPGYWLLGSDGGIFSYGVPFHGSTGNLRLVAPVVGMAAPDIGGYWLVARDGGVFAFGDAAFEGSVAQHARVSNVVGIAADKAKGGYWVVASDGGVFAFGGAPYFGGLPGRGITDDIVSIAATPSGQGYYLISKQGRLYPFGDALSALAGVAAPGAEAVSGASDPASDGLWVLRGDGGVFAYEAPFHGSLGSVRLNSPMVAMAPNDEGGYWLAASDGGVFALGDAPFRGSAGGLRLQRPVVGLATP